MPTLKNKAIYGIAEFLVGFYVLFCVLAGVGVLTYEQSPFLFAVAFFCAVRSMMGMSFVSEDKLSWAKDFGLVWDFVAIISSGLVHWVLHVESGWFSSGLWLLWAFMVACAGAIVKSKRVNAMSVQPQ